MGTLEEPTDHIIRTTMKKFSSTLPRQNSTQGSLPIVSAHIVFFILMWIFYGGYYGCVFHLAQQNSFFSTDTGFLNTLWQQSYGSLWIIGRALLQLFYYPWLGGFVLSAMLTLISWLFGYVCKFRGRTAYLKFIPAFVYLFIVLFQGFNIYYETETGIVLGIPFCILLILVLQSIFIRSFSKKNMPPLFRRPTDENIVNNWTSHISIVLLLLLAVLFNECQRDYVRPTTQMQIQLDKADWKGMKATAESCDMTYPTIAAYFAIARMEDQTDIPEVPLEALPSPGKRIYLHNRHGKAENGRNYALIDYCLSAGQLDTAYALAKDKLQADGPSAYLLKRLVRITLAKEKADEAKAYLNQLRQLPFEKNFIRRYADKIEK